MLFLAKFLPIFFVAVLGLVIGSFLNVCIYRIPQRNFFEKSRSYCPHCGHTLAAKDLVPLFSYIFLGGKCRYCRERISPQYPIIEALTSILFVCAYLKFGYSIYTAIVMLTIAGLIVLSVIDIRTMEIPNGIVIYLAALGLITALLGIFVPDIMPYPLKWYEYLIGAFCISLPFFLFACFGAMGGGDVKLMFAVGLLLGWRATLLGTFAGFLIGAVVGVVQMIMKKNIKVWCSELFERHFSVDEGNSVSVQYDDCNPFGMVAGDFGEIDKLNKHKTAAAPQSTIDSFNKLSELFATFMQSFEIPTDGAKYIPDIQEDVLKKYTAFYDQAVGIFNDDSLTGFTQEVEGDLSRSAVIGINHPYTMTFGGDVDAQLVDYQSAAANLFGFCSTTEFTTYAQTLADIYAEHRNNIAGALPTNEALDNGCFYTSDGSFVFPVAVKNELPATVLAYLILDKSGFVSLWVNDMRAVLWAINYNSSYRTTGMIKNELFCKNRIFITGLNAIPFGPSLAAGAVIAIFVGNEVVNLYLGR